MSVETQIYELKGRLAKANDLYMDLVMAVDDIENNVPIADRIPVGNQTISDIGRILLALEGIILRVEYEWDQKQPRLPIEVKGEPTGTTYADKMKFAVDLMCRPARGYFDVFVRTVVNNVLIYKAVGRNRTVCLESLVELQKNITENTNWVLAQYDGHMHRDETETPKPSTTGISVGEQKILVAIGILSLQIQDLTSLVNK